MLAILLAAFFAQVFLYLLQRNGFREIRESLLKAALVFGAVVAFATESLSFFRAINGEAAASFWAVANVVMGVLLASSVRSSPASYRDGVETVRTNLSGWQGEREVQVLFSIAAFIFGVVLLIALWAPPNTSDSMTYHMARVANWIQHGSVEHYPTVILRQLYQNPLAEYAILHLQLLAGDDRWANLVQVAAFAGSATAASLICKEFGLDRKLQAAAVVLAATVPVAILQASSTKNDLVVSLFTLSFFLFFLRFALNGRWSDCTYAGVALGTALLSKGTALPFCFAVGIVIFATYFFRKQSAGERFRFALRTAMTAAIALAIIAPMLVRNFNTFGSPTTTGDDKVANQRITPAIVASNIYRNYASHLGSLSGAANKFIENSGKQIFGSEFDNPDATFLKIKFDIEFSLHEDLSGNLLHLLLLTLSLPAVLFCRRAFEKKLLAVNALVVVLGFLLYCMLLMYQPWAPRLHMPLFMLGVPVMTAALARFGERAKALAVLLCVLGALPFLLLGEPRTVLPVGDTNIFTSSRHEQYFANKTDLAAVHEDAARFLKEKGASEVGLYFSHYSFADYGDWEYAMWICLKDDFDFAAGPVIRQVGVTNASGKLNRNGPAEWVFSTRDGETIDGSHYTEVWKGGTARILHRTDLE